MPGDHYSKWMLDSQDAASSALCFYTRYVQTAPSFVAVFTAFVVIVFMESKQRLDFLLCFLNATLQK